MDFRQASEAGRNPLCCSVVAAPSPPSSSSLPPQVVDIIMEDSCKPL